MISPATAGFCCLGSDILLCLFLLLIGSQAEFLQRKQRDGGGGGDAPIALITMLPIALKN